MKGFRLQDKSFWGFRYAFEGLYRAICKEPHFRFHICAAIGTTMFTEYYDFSRYDYALLFLAIALVISAELVNTAIEHTVDLITEEYNEKAKYAKDAAAAFVLMCSLFSVAVAFVLFFDTKIIFSAFADAFTRIKYIAFFVFTILFVRGVRREKKDDR